MNFLIRLSAYYITIFLQWKLKNHLLLPPFKNKRYDQPQ